MKYIKMPLDAPPPEGKPYPNRALDQIVNRHNSRRSATKAAYLDARDEGLALLKEKGIEFKPRVLWWPTPKQYFQRFREQGELFFLYDGDDAAVRETNAELRQLWEAYLAEAEDFKGFDKDLITDLKQAKESNT